MDNMDSNKEFNEKFERLIQRLLEGRVVPFLGAGISSDAQHEDGIIGLARTKRLIGKLAQAIYGSCQIGNSNEKKWGRWCYGNGNISLTKNSLDNLCEMYVWLKGDNGQRSLVNEVLEIPKFEGLLPTYAHYYLAFLAREGLVDEIITTNYDTCLEKAYRQTFDAIVSNNNKDKDPACVITNLDSYRQYSGKTHVNNGQSQLKCLKIYKINGCATQANDIPDTILLTERQLQDWRERQWAKDLFRERLRSRSLVFSGFGSYEPQVRHTVLQVVEEFGQVKDTESEDEYCWDRPNAPFIAVYEPHFQFNQMQILHAYAEAHCAPREYNELYQNVFCGKDASFFDPIKSELTELSADLFWERVYQAAFWKLLKRSCQIDSPAYAFLSALTTAAEALFYKMLKWLVPPDKAFGRFPELLTVADSKTGLTPLSTWVSCIRNRCNPLQGWYASLSDRPVLIPMLLMLLYIMVGDKDRNWDKLREHIVIQNGFLFFNRNEENELSTMVMISHPDQALHNYEKVGLPYEKTDYNLVQIIIGNGVNVTAKKIRIQVTNYDSQHIRFVSVNQMPIADIFKFAAGPDLDNTAYRHFIENETVLIADKVRPRLRNRTSLL